MGLRPRILASEGTGGDCSHLSIQEGLSVRLNPEKIRSMELEVQRENSDLPRMSMSGPVPAPSGHPWPSSFLPQDGSQSAFRIPLVSPGMKPGAWGLGEGPREAVGFLSY